MVAIIVLADLPAAIQSHELAAVMVAGANAKASRVAPCLTWTGTPTTEPVPTADQLAEAKLILIGAVKRWAESGSGALQSQNAGPYSMTVDTRQRTGFNLWPSDITDLQAICKAAAGGNTGAFSVDTVGYGYGLHSDWCSINFGALYCSCGVDIAGYPLFDEPA